MHIPRSLLWQAMWHALVILMLASLPVLKYEALWWQIPKRELLPVAILIAAYGACALAVMMFVRESGWRAIGRALLFTLSIFGLVAVAFMVLRLDAPRYALLPAFLAAVFLVPLAVGPRVLRLAGITALAVGTVGAAALSARAVNNAAQPGDLTTSTSTVKTALYALRLVAHQNVVPAPATRGGGLDRFGDRVLLGTGEGLLYLLTVQGEAIEAQRLPATVPSNRKEFAEALGGDWRAPQRSSGYAHQAGVVQTWRYRMADVIAQIRGDSVRILASHHFWNAQERCIVVRVSQIEGRMSALEDSLRSAQWQTIFESQPCLPMEGPNRLRAKNPFRGEEIGGRMALLDENTLLLTLGDHGFSGVESVQAFAQDPNASYGKTVSIDLNDHSSRIYTSGHRNPQGLFAARDGRIWETEHASQGGDEINLLTTGANYGWPLVTYGTDYGSFLWPLNEQQGRHERFVKPVYSWVPSVGPSNVIQLDSERFPAWRGDLLVGSLATRSLYRNVLDSDRVVLSEPIKIDRRIRDLLELQDGRILLWTDDNALVLVEPATETGPALDFAVQCSGCHSIDDGASHRIGPDLYGLMNRGVGGASTYGAYSPALQNAGGSWTKQRLDAFLRDPQAAVPGNSMAFPGISDDKQRAELVDYIVLMSERGGL